MKPEKRKLIHDLLDDDPKVDRESTLLAGGRILRRRRHVRHAVRIGSLTVVLTLALLWLQFQSDRPAANQLVQIENTHSNPTAPTASNPSPAPTLQVESLTDEELLALFPDTPVGLVTLSDGRKKLIFPRPGDEQRFITHL